MGRDGWLAALVAGSVLVSTAAPAATEPATGAVERAEVRPEIEVVLRGVADLVIHGRPGELATAGLFAADVIVVQGQQVSQGLDELLSLDWRPPLGPRQIVHTDGAAVVQTHFTARTLSEDGQQVVDRTYTSLWRLERRGQTQVVTMVADGVAVETSRRPYEQVFGYGGCADCSCYAGRWCLHAAWPYEMCSLSCSVCSDCGAR